MKLTITRELFNSALQVVASLAKPNSINESLKCIRMEGRDGFLVLSTCDGDMFASSRVAVEGIESFDILIPAERLAPLASAFPAETMEFSLHGAQVSLIGGRAKYKLPWLDAGPFPRAQLGTMHDMAKMPCSTLRRWLSVARPATKASGKGWDRGVYIETQHGQFSVVGCDSKRLHVMRDALGLQPDATVLKALPAVGDAAKLESMLPDAEDIEVLLLRDQAALMAKWGNSAVRLPLMDAEYPPYETMLRPESASALHVEIKPFVAALSRLTKLTSAKEALPAVTMTAEGEMVGLAAAGLHESTSGNEEVAGDLRGEALSITYNPTFVLDALKCVAGEHATMKFDGPGKAILISGPRSPEFIAVVMPIPTGGPS